MSYKGTKHIEPDTCPECGGTGYKDHFFIMNIHTREEIEVSEEEWGAYPDDEDVAEEEGTPFVQMEREKCPMCHGYGFIEY